MNVICVDDLKVHRQDIKDSVSKMSHSADCCNGAEARALTAEKALTYDVAILDQNLDDNITGEEVGRALRSKNPRIFLIMLTAFGTVERTARAMHDDGFNYFLTKPVDEELLRRVMLIAENAIGYLNMNDADLFHQVQSKGISLVGVHEKFVQAVRKSAMVANSNAGILLLGESGTGKELFASLIKMFSDRSAQPFIKINCAAIPDTLLESELFGHEKGAFTGANKQRKGRVEDADNGTLFLDEIADMSLHLQAKMLRFLEDGSFTRVGGNTELKVDVRLIAATNKKLEDEITKGKFREDLFYRLNVVQVNLPPLRERASDIPILAIHFLKEFCSKQSGRPRIIEPAAMSALAKEGWRGNVRDLRNVIREATILAKNKDTISISDLRIHNSPALLSDARPAHISNPADTSDGVEVSALRQLCQEIERTDGKHIQNSSDVLLKTYGAAMLKNVLAVFYNYYKANSNHDRFNKLFGCKSPERPSVEIKHDLVRFSKDVATSAVFTPKSGTNNYCLRDLEKDGKALAQNGIALANWIPSI